MHSTTGHTHIQRTTVVPQKLLLLMECGDVGTQGYIYRLMSSIPAATATSIVSRRLRLYVPFPLLFVQRNQTNTEKTRTYATYQTGKRAKEIEPSVFCALIICAGVSRIA
jgi:hypothetical protein